MPANKKYLTKSPWLRLAKILAGVVGGYAVMLSFHVALATFLPKNEVVATAFITGYIVWAFLLLWAFVARNVWRVWLTYALLTLVFLLPYFLTQHF
ncbi:hypothetical protein BC792_11320 [Sphingobacterium allocomposti]|uniref:Iron uptake protein n=1 Tax=Sphingobacterium allocomposti TaxID=415956 RepID=A0A5S5DHM1_9SPHI|nr:hypothetical protein [Sphingobacterium composti Yoo et al. 2007 non Ten et al. 2007]TYP94152.1 hypothetical protein BC792_11320 [Sphingobacterium composti Yoo et al. 2007 non Ten et al. 2007]